MANPLQLGHLSINPTPTYVKPRIKADRAAYMIQGKGFFDGHELLNPGTTIYFDGEPNSDFLPMNKMGYDKMQEFLDKIELQAERAAKKAGNSYVKPSREPWVEDGENEIEIKLPESLMGVRTEKRTDVIR